MLTPEDVPPVTAYCAPGRKTSATLVLAARGERVTEVKEHPWLEGTTDIMLVADSSQIEPPFPPPTSPQPPFPAEWLLPRVLEPLARKWHLLP